MRPFDGECGAWQYYNTQERCELVDQYSRKYNLGSYKFFSQIAKCKELERRFRLDQEASPDAEPDTEAGAGRLKHMCPTTSVCKFGLQAGWECATAAASRQNKTLPCGSRTCRHLHSHRGSCVMCGLMKEGQSTVRVSNMRSYLGSRPTGGQEQRIAELISVQNSCCGKQWKHTQVRLPTTDMAEVFPVLLQFHNNAMWVDGLVYIPGGSSDSTGGHQGDGEVEVQEIVRCDKSAVKTGCRRLHMAQAILVAEGFSKSSIALELVVYKVEYAAGAEEGEEDRPISDDILQLAGASGEIEVRKITEVVNKRGEQVLRGLHLA